MSVFDLAAALVQFLLSNAIRCSLNFILGLVCVIILLHLYICEDGNTGGRPLKLLSPDLADGSCWQSELIEESLQFSHGLNAKQWYLSGIVGEMLKNISNSLYMLSVPLVQMEIKTVDKYFLLKKEDTKKTEYFLRHS